MDLTAEMEKYLRLLQGRQFPAPPPEALFSAAGNEIFGLEIHLTFNAAPYLLIGKWIENMPEPPTRILDLGCGTGYDTLYLKEHFAPAASITGLDLVPSLVKYAAENYSRSGLQFINGDSSILSFREESLDLVIAVFSIVHTMTRATARNCLAEIARVLKPGGTLIFSTPNRELSQDLYHENPGNKPGLFFCHLIRTEYYREELASLFLSLTGKNKGSFGSVSIDSLANIAFRPAWEDVLTTMKKKRFGPSRRMAFFSSLARRYLPAGFKARYFFKMVRKACRKRNISLLDIARGARHYPESDGVKGEHFLVVARKGERN